LPVRPPYGRQTPLRWPYGYRNPRKYAQYVAIAHFADAVKGTFTVITTVKVPFTASPGVSGGPAALADVEEPESVRAEPARLDRKSR
jgi:hypothetical protein